MVWVKLYNIQIMAKGGHHLESFENFLLSPNHSERRAMALYLVVVVIFLCLAVQINCSLDVFLVVPNNDSEPWEDCIKSIK